MEAIADLLLLFERGTSVMSVATGRVGHAPRTQLKHHALWRRGDRQHGTCREAETGEDT